MYVTSTSKQRGCFGVFKGLGKRLIAGTETATTDRLHSSLPQGK